MKTRPATLSQWVFFDEGQKFSCMLGSTLDHAKWIRRNNRPLIYIHDLGGRRKYRYSVGIYLVEGFDCGNYVFTTEAKSLVISIMTEGRKFKSNCVFRPGCVWSFMYAYYTTLEEAVEVANGLAALDSTCFTNLTQAV